MILQKYITYFKSYIWHRRIDFFLSRSDNKYELSKVNCDLMNDLAQLFFFFFFFDNEH